MTRDMISHLRQKFGIAATRNEFARVAEPEPAF